MYQNVSATEMISAIDNGWHPAWFAIENSTLSVDMCVNYRLADSKVLFLKFYSTDPQELSRVANEVAKKAKENWIKTLDKMSENLDEQIEEVTKSEKNIANIDWVENQKYLFTYSPKDQVTYECTCASDNDIYVKKVLAKDEYNYCNSEKNVREVVFGKTKIELIN